MLLEVEVVLEGVEEEAVPPDVEPGVIRVEDLDVEEFAVGIEGPLLDETALVVGQADGCGVEIGLDEPEAARVAATGDPGLIEEGEEAVGVDGVPDIRPAEA